MMRWPSCPHDFEVRLISPVIVVAVAMMDVIGQAVLAELVHNVRR